MTEHGGEEAEGEVTITSFRQHLPQARPVLSSLCGSSHSIPSTLLFPFH